jgi:hypothetical protein
MQKWLLMVVAVLALVTATPLAQAENAADVEPVKSPDGVTLGLLVQCNSCVSATGESKKCHTGVEEGYLDGQPCGKCMITENYGAAFSYPYDLHFIGKLVDAQGQPVKDRFVKVFMANGWNIRSRTAQDGGFRLMLGATAERKSSTPLVVNLGTRVDSPKGNKDYYAMFLLPDGYKACAANKPGPQKPRAKKK